MPYDYLRLVPLFAMHGVVHRERVKNHPGALRKLLRRGFVAKVSRSGRVYYELTERALSLLEHQRRKLLEDAQMYTVVEEHHAFFSSLLTDVRFLDEKRPEAKQFLFLGDWQLTRPVVPAQLALAKLRFYRDHVRPRRRKSA